MKTVLSLCDRTANMLKPWASAGYECIAVDIQHEGESTVDGITYIGADVRDYIPPMRDYAACFAFPPCTHLAGSGARWWKAKGLGKLAEAINIVERCRVICEWTGAPWLIENPVGALSTHWRKPDYTFNPCDFGGYLNPAGDAYTKRTCLWTGGGFSMPKSIPVNPVEGSKMHLLPPTPNRADLRSETPIGFARAVFMELTGAQP